MNMPKVVKNPELVEEEAPRPEPKPNEIFEKDANKEEAKEPEPEPEPVAEVEPVKPVKKEEKKKRVMSEKQLEALRKGRERSLAKRKENAGKKKEIKQLKNKALDNELETLKQQQVKPIEPTPKAQPQYNYNISAEDIENITTKAINNYEIIRKARKEEKRQKQLKEKQEKEIAKTIRSYGSTYAMRF